MSNPKKVTASSGNVFADLGFGNPEEELFKAKLVREIRGIIKRRKLTQTKAAAMLGLKQPDVSHSGAMRSIEPGISRFRVCA
jgi:predicted XRE-type DNA-binding protein